jgi:hypothetical protein
MSDSNQSFELPHNHNSQPDKSSLNLSDDLKDDNPTVYFGVSITRLVWLFLLTMGFYRFYWFYKNWKAIKESEHADISPFWRSCFAIFFCRKLFVNIEESVKRYSNKKLFSPSSLSSWYIILPLVGLGFLNLFILIKLQRVINFNNRQVIAGYKPTRKFSLTEIILIVIWSLIWLISIHTVIFKTEPGTASSQHAISWISFQTDDKNFEIKFPTYPQYEKLEMPIGTTKLNAHYEGYTSMASQGIIYSLSRITYPPEIELNKIHIEKFIEDILQLSSGNKLISSQNTQVGKQKAIDFLVQNRAGYMKGRIVLAGQVKYLLLVSYSEESYKEKDYCKFIDSFSLKSML